MESKNITPHAIILGPSASVLNGKESAPNRLDQVRTAKRDPRATRPLLTLSRDCLAEKLRCCATVAAASLSFSSLKLAAPSDFDLSQ